MKEQSKDKFITKITIPIKRGKTRASIEQAGEPIYEYADWTPKLQVQHDKMIRDLAMKPFQSSFLSAEKDTDIILRKLFIESKPYSDILKSLLVVNTNDCLDNYQKSEYKKVIDKATPAWLKKNGYLINVPRVCLKEFDEKKNFLIYYQFQLRILKFYEYLHDLTLYLGFFLFSPTYL